MPGMAIRRQQDHPGVIGSPASSSFSAGPGPVSARMAWWTAPADHPDHARLRVDGPAGSRVVRLGWSETRPAGLLAAIARAGRTDLLTVPPHAGEPAARAAMDQAGQAGNRTRTPALLAAITAAAIPGRPPAGTRAGATPDSIQLSTWGMGRRTGRHQIGAGGHLRCDLAAMPGS